MKEEKKKRRKKGKLEKKKWLLSKLKVFQLFKPNNYYCKQVNFRLLLQKFIENLLKI